MADYVVRMTGQDNLSGVLDNIKKRLKETGGAGSSLDNIVDKFKRITEGSAPLNRKLKDTQQLIAQMHFEGLQDDELFTTMIEQAGLFKDAIADAASEVRGFSSDTTALDASITAIKGLTGVATIATGALNLFGVENDKVNQAILKVQSTMAILNGVQTVSNALNKSSILILKMKQLAEVGSTVTAATLTTQLKAMATAEMLAGAKQKISTGIQWAWNVAKAIGMAILGNYTGLALLAVGAVVGLTMALRSDTDATKENNEAKDKLQTTEERLNEKRKEATDQIVKQSAKAIAAYKGMQYQWNQLTSDVERTKWIEDNKSKFEQLGFSITDVQQAEEFFARQTNAVVDALQKRAKAAAMYELYVKALEEQYEANHATVDTSQWEYKGEGSREEHNKKVEVERTIAFQNLYTRREAAAKRVLELEKDMATANQEMADAFARIEQFEKKDPPKPTSSSQNTYEKGSLKELKARRDIVQQQLESKRLTDEQVAQYQGLLTALNEQIAAEEERLRILGYEEGSLADLQDQAKRYQEILKTGKYESSELPVILQEIKALDEKIRLKKIELGMEEPDPAPGSLKALEAELDRLEALRTETRLSDEELASLNAQIAAAQQLLDAEKERLGLKEKAAPAGSTKALSTQISAIKTRMELSIVGSDEYNEFAKTLKELESKQHIIQIALENGITEEAAQKLYEFDQNFQKMQETTQQWSEVASSGGAAFSSLGQAIGGTTGSIAEMVGETISAAGQIIPQIVSLIAARQAEALAGGTASAAAMPFPANLAAIASIVATITALFASFAGKFAEGGIVGGSSYYGDKLWARVNSGEMILNSAQQASLYGQLQGSGRKLQVNWRIQGSDLVGCIDNYNNKTSKYS